MHGTDLAYRPMRCLVLSQRIGLRACYVMSGADAAYGATQSLLAQCTARPHQPSQAAPNPGISLRAHYAISGTDLASGATTRSLSSYRPTLGQALRLHFCRNLAYGAVCCYAMCGTDVLIVYGAVCCYAMSGTDLLVACMEYAMSSTDLVYGATRSPDSVLNQMLLASGLPRDLLSPYALPKRCPVLT
eukprot:675179-Rhodomonas_salina.3